MAGGTCGLFPSLEAQRREQAEKEKKILPETVRKVALCMEGKNDMPVREFVEAVKICDRNGLHTTADIVKAFHDAEDANDEN